tara:strand:- start:9535 stop:9885 length:351 start_codon:yes stop_codon:yes gene_type:complete
LAVKRFFPFDSEANVEQKLPKTLEHKNGGEGGIRTRDTLLRYTPLAGERLQPLGHLSVTRAEYYLRALLNAMKNLMKLTIWFVILFLLDALVDFFTVNSHFFGCIDPNSYLITFNA